jgi:acyl-CoA synthetase (AMP-forming)/AMP-acid ligase II
MTDLLHDLTVGDVLAEHRRSRPRKVAVVCGEVRLTYPELEERTRRLANAFGKLGVERSSTVMWIGQNCHRLLECYLACARLGAVFCPANWRSSAEELVVLLDDCRPSVVVWQETEIGATVRKARAAWQGKATWLAQDLRGPDGYEELLSSGSPEETSREVDPDWPVLQLYTAAFGGSPNGALLAHRAILSQDLVVAMVQQITDETVYLNSGPMFHMATLMTTFATFRMGGTNVMARRVDAEELCRLIETEGCNYGFVMGPTAQQIAEVNAEGRYDLSGFRTFGGGDRWNAMIKVDSSPWGRHPAGYGQTELTGMGTFNAFGVGAIGSSGRPSPLVQVRIVDPDGNEVPDGETGEIVARGPIVTEGYHNRPELNAKRMQGGWWHTGDLGRREEDGSVTFVAPLTRIVKSAAENIYPAEVESCLVGHPAVKEAAVIGVPDPAWTQKVLAVVVLNQGSTATAEELIEHCRSRIASYKKPSRIEFVDALPRKGFAVDYDELDRRFGGGGYPGSGT